MSTFLIAAPEALAAFEAILEDLPQAGLLAVTSPDVLHADNPGLIIARMSGYGQTGPYSDRAGFGGIGEAMGGWRYIVGDPDRPPARMGVSIGDTLCATSTWQRKGGLASTQATRRLGNASDARAPRRSRCGGPKGFKAD